MREPNNIELKNLEKAKFRSLYMNTYLHGQKKVVPVDFKQASDNILTLYKRISIDSSNVDMQSWHNEVANENNEPCGTSHCLGGWAQVLFDESYVDNGYYNEYDPESIGYKYIWPVAHLFYDTDLTKTELLTILEEFLQSVGYELE